MAEILMYSNMSGTYLITTFIAALVLVVAAVAIATFVAPSSKNKQKYDPYECGIPTTGVTWLQFNVGYYLFAILFLIFDVETVFMFPWAVVMADMGIVAFVEIFIFLVILIMGLAYAWKKGALTWE